ncbi:FABP family protein [Brachybacterium sp. AOP43-C2-M15]|uniref:FABP family protein n=1 Tax=Brachybacterium sp. AOP43-C2-M15 TaxID=3457661 RepID=UPI0040344DC3
MPITLDTSLPESLYPLAWLIGSWEGSGALTATEPGAADARIEQQLVCTAREDGALDWRSTIHRVDAPAPLPPTSVFAREDAPPQSPTGSGERSLLHREDGVWSVGEPLPGQDRAAAAAAAPGTPASYLSHHLDARLERRGEAEETWSGEVRGPRVQLALAGDDGRVGATRMIGYVSGRLMWLWERRTPVADGAPGETALSPYLSLELHRA